MILFTSEHWGIFLFLPHSLKSKDLGT